MTVTLLLKGMAIGFSIAAPVGPIGVLCIRRTLSEGRASGRATGLGAATANGIFGSIAAFGLTVVSDFLVNQQVWLRLIGGVLLCYPGLRIMLSRSSEQAAAIKGNGLLGAYASTFLLTLTNPMTIISFAAVFAGLGLASTGGNYMQAGAVVTAVFAGSALWWFALSTGIGIFQRTINHHRLQWVNRISGAVIIGFGLFALWSGVLRIV